MKVVESYCKIIEANHIVYTYNYKLTMGNILIKLKNSTKYMNSYGIYIEKLASKEGKIIEVSTDKVESISPDKDKVRELLLKMYDNTLSPDHLIEIIEEYVDNFIFDFNKI